MLGGAVSGFVYEYVFQTPEEISAHDSHERVAEERPAEA